jgi:hypothetical protein
MKKSLLEADYWGSIMGQELMKSDFQPLQPASVSRNNTIQIMCLSELGFTSADRFTIEVQDTRCTLRRAKQGELTIDKRRLTVSDEVRAALSQPNVDGAMLIGRKGEATILPVFVQEYPPDPLGPRFIDELLSGCIIRHAIPGPACDEWTAETLGDLVEMTCSEPFSVDPIKAISQGDDWVGWMTRNRLLGQPVSGVNGIMGVAFESGKYDREAQIEITQEIFDSDYNLRHSIKHPESALSGAATLLAARADLLDAGDDAAYVKWCVLERRKPIVRINQLLDPLCRAGSKCLSAAEMLLDVMELYGFRSWRPNVENVVDCLWQVRRENGLWNFGATCINPPFLSKIRFADNWRSKRGAHDWTTRVLLFLQKYYENEEF